jgi:hypothetical protein
MKGQFLTACACLGVLLVSIPAAIQAQTLVIEGGTLIDMTCSKARERDLDRNGEARGCQFE